MAVSRLRLRLYKAAALLMLAACSFAIIEAFLPSSLKLPALRRQPAIVDFLIILTTPVLISLIQPVCRAMFRLRGTAASADRLPDGPDRPA